jgi:hypothetical protein
MDNQALILSYPGWEQETRALFAKLAASPRLQHAFLNDPGAVLADRFHPHGISPAGPVSIENRLFFQLLNDSEVLAMSKTPTREEDKPSQSCADLMRAVLSRYGDRLTGIPAETLLTPGYNVDVNLKIDAEATTAAEIDAKAIVDAATTLELKLGADVEIATATAIKAHLETEVSTSLKAQIDAELVAVTQVALKTVTETAAASAVSLKLHTDAETITSLDVKLEALATANLKLEAIAELESRADSILESDAEIVGRIDSIVEAELEAELGAAAEGIRQPQRRRTAGLSRMDLQKVAAFIAARPVLAHLLLNGDAGASAPGGAL